MSKPLSCQFRRNSLFPYHFRNSPPLLCGNHLVKLRVAALKDVCPNPIFEISTSNHNRRNRSLSAVATPCRGVPTSFNCFERPNTLRACSLTQYARGLPGIFG